MIKHCLLNLCPGDKILYFESQEGGKFFTYEIASQPRLRGTKDGIVILCRYFASPAFRTEEVGFGFNETQIKIVKADK